MTEASSIIINDKLRRSSRKVVEPSEKYKSSLNAIDFEIGLRVFHDENVSRNFDAVRDDWNALSDTTKMSFINKIPIQNINRRKKQLIVIKDLEPVKKKTKSRGVNKRNMEVAAIAVNQHEPVEICLEIQRLIGLPASYISQPVCHVCERFSVENPAVRCAGDRCHKFIHHRCNNTESEASLLCGDCSENKRVCGFCKMKLKESSINYVCQMPGCNRVYHSNCIKSLNFPYISCDNDSRTVTICPAHFCLTCVRENAPFHKCFSKKLISCIRCSNSFHLYDLCTMAGSVELSLSSIICPRHFVAQLIRDKQYATFNVTTCVSCFKSGAKIKCTYCPRVYHPECVVPQIDSDKELPSFYVCSECKLFRSPRIASVLLVKLCNYRWWPCEVVHTRNGPMNLVRNGWIDGTFLVRFLGTNEYQWISQNRSIPYNLAERLGLVRMPTSKKQIDKSFGDGVIEAAKVHRVYVNILRKYVPLKSMTAEPMSDGELDSYINYPEGSQQTPKFENLSANVVISPAKLPQRQKTPVCGCCGTSCPDSDCSNMCKQIQCNPSTCPSGASCGNQPFSPSALIDKNSIGVYKTPDRGYGLVVLVDLEPNQFIYEYVGEVITETMADARVESANHTNVGDLYMFRLDHDAGLVLDAGPKGNLTRFLNHSCNPNCVLKRWMVDGLPRLGIFARKRIQNNDELTVNYHESGALPREDKFCLCCSANCCGYITLSGNRSMLVTTSPRKEQSQAPQTIAALDKDTTEERPISPLVIKKEGRTSRKSSSAAAADTMVDEYVVTKKSAHVVTPKESRRSSRSRQIQEIDQKPGPVPPLSPYTSSSTNRRKSWKADYPRQQQSDCATSSEKSATDATLQTSTTETDEAIDIVEEELEHMKQEVIEEADIVNLDVEEEHHAISVQEAADVPVKGEEFPQANLNILPDQCSDEIGKIPMVSEEKMEQQPEDLTQKVEEAAVKIVNFGHTIDTSESSTMVLEEVQHTAHILSPQRVEPLFIINASSSQLAKVFPKPQVSSPAAVCRIPEKKKEESYCFRCFDGGNLIVCEKRNCTKTYHLSCLSLPPQSEGMIKDKWFCPWHFCCVCNVRSTCLCRLCPRGFCDKHRNDPLLTRHPFPSGSNCTYCCKHSDELVSKLQGQLTLISRQNEA